MALALPQLQVELATARRLWLEATGEELHEDRITCKTCEINDNCEFSFDGYNTDGDCLALK